MFKKDQILRSLLIIGKKIKESFSLKDSLVFLFFLFVSSSLWFIRTLRKDFDKEIQMPLVYVNMPNGYVQTLELPDYITVRVTDRGTAILGMLIGKRFEPIPVDLRDLVHKHTLVTSSLAEEVQNRLNTTSVIRGFYPDSIHFRMLKLDEKVVPVRFSGNIEMERQYMLCDSVELRPNVVTVYAPKSVLDTISFALTENVTFENVKDTLETRIGMLNQTGISYSEDKIELCVRTEQYTEKTLEVPVFVQNLPSGLNLRLFPSCVDLSFNVGISAYDKIDASSFSLSVDYRDVLDKNKKLKVKVAYNPKETFHLNLKPSEVDFLVEAKQ